MVQTSKNCHNAVNIIPVQEAKKRSLKDIHVVPLFIGFVPPQCT